MKRETYETFVDNDALISKAYHQVVEYDDPIDMQDFSDLYKDVDSDLAYVAEMERIFAMSYKDLSDVERIIHEMAKAFEMIVSQQIESSNWLGETAMTVQASKYDDFRNGVDTIVKLDNKEASTHLALAIDVTASTGLQKKFDRIKSEIDNGVLTRVKYFVSESMDVRGEKKNVPRVVIGADREKIIDLIDKWVKKDNKALAQHVIQAVVLEEIITQLEAFAKYAELVEQTNAAEAYKKALAILTGIRKEKGLSPELLAEAHDDLVFEAIKNNLYSFRK